jgi:hypothetical protein
VLSENESTEVRNFVGAHEYGIALETLCGILLEEGKHITREQYDSVQAMSGRLTSVDRARVDAVRTLLSSS